MHLYTLLGRRFMEAAVNRPRSVAHGEITGVTVRAKVFFDMLGRATELDGGIGCDDE